jgi:hypothetical protein
MSSILNWGGGFTFPYGCIATVQKDYERNTAGIAMAEKHTITVKGAIAASGGGPSSLNALITAAGSASDISAGTTQIATMSLNIEGQQTFEYDNARLTSFSSSDPPEDTAGIQYIEVSFTFEAYTAVGDYLLASSSESLEVKKEEDRLSVVNNDIASDQLNFGYTVTHTVSAQGINGDTDAYTQAKGWVESRLKSTSKSLSLTKDGMSSNLQSAVNIDDLMGALPDIECNAIRSVNADPASGSHSVTTTFFRTGSNSTCDITVNVERTENGDVTCTASGSIQGLSTDSVTSSTSSKFQNASSAFTAICGNFGSGSKIYSVISTLFGKINPEGVVLDDFAIGLSVGENKTNGSMNFNVTYRAYPPAVKALMNTIGDCLSASITFTHDNEAGNSLDTQVFASIPIIGRMAGPVLQDMGTTRERKKGVNVEAIVKPIARSPGNDAPRKACLTEAAKYAPAGTIFRSNVNSNWDFAAGRASASIEWTYQ